MYAWAATERLALIALGRSTNSSSWVFNAGWLTDQHHCDWDLVGCSHDGHVTALTLSFNGLSGQLPDNLGDLTMLEVFDVESNELSGTVPSSLARLQSLKQLGLGDNHFSGLLPDLCGTPAVHGVACDLSANNFKCPLPDCACNAVCSQEAVESMSPNPAAAKTRAYALQPSLQDPTTAMISSMSTLASDWKEYERDALVAFATSTQVWGWLTHRNWLTAAPTCDWEFVHCDSQGRVKLLSLGFNNLTGTLPSTIANLSRLQNLDLVFNHIEGTVPNIFGSLKHLLQLGLGANAFKGSVPSSICTTVASGHNACNCFGNSFDCPLPICIQDHCKLSCSNGTVHV